MVSLANNHIFDWSKEGYYRTTELLDDLSIGYFGVQKEEEGWPPLSVDIAGVPFDFYGCGWKEEQVISLGKSSLFIKDTDLNNLPYPKVNHNRVSVVMPHWGYEYEFLPLPVFVEYARNLLDKGVDLVVGSHPHVIQPCEQYRGKHILYSLGNFYFGSRRPNFAVGLCDYSQGFELTIPRPFSKPISRIITLRYGRDKESTEIIDSSDPWAMGIIDFKIPENVQQYNEIYRKCRYGFKYSLLAGQKKKNNLKMRFSSISNGLRKILTGSISKIIR